LSTGSLYASALPNARVKNRRLRGRRKIAIPLAAIDELAAEWRCAQLPE
jgi:hypothetical protein